METRSDDNGEPPDISPDGEPGVDVIDLRRDLEEVRAEVSTLRASVAELTGELAALRSSLGG
jgi:hypothetical protein